MAQHSFPKFLFSLNGGASIPTGNFAKGDYADETSGYAKTGGQFNMTGTRYLNKDLGVTLLLGYSSFGKNGTQSLADGYREDSGTDSTTLYSKGSNYSVSFLIGPSYCFHPGKELFIDARALVGYVSSHLAGFQIFYEDYTTNSMSQNASSAGAFGFQGGMGVGYQFSKSVGGSGQWRLFHVQAKVYYHVRRFCGEFWQETYDLRSAGQWVQCDHWRQLFYFLIQVIY